MPETKKSPLFKYSKDFSKTFNGGDGEIRTLVQNGHNETSTSVGYWLVSLKEG